jgi:uncharacterized membrane protein
VSIVGYILTLIAVKYVSDELQDSSIFNEMILAVITGIVGVAVGAALLVYGFVGSLFTLGASAFLGIISFLAILWIAFIISAVFVRRAFDKMATRLNVGHFRTAGTLYLVGAILVIVLVGFVILFVAFIFQILAFFSIQEALQPAPGQPMAATSTTQPGMKACANCGTQMASSALFCPKCGAKQPV